MKSCFGSLSFKQAFSYQHRSSDLPRQFRKHAGCPGIAAYLKLFVLTFCLSVLLGAYPATAHNDPHPEFPVVTTAKDVVLDREQLQEFVNHASLHFFSTSTFTESLNLMNSFRVQGQWRSGSVYLILLTKKGGVYIHPGDRELEDQDWSKVLMGCSGESWSELVSKGAGCVKYAGQDTDSTPTGYAVVTGGPFIPFSKPSTGAVVEEEFVLIGGLDYRPAPESYDTFEDLKDSLIDDFRSTNPDIQDEAEFRMQFDQVLTPSIDAADVRTQNHMRVFLADAFNFLAASFELELFDPVILRKILRYDGGPWRNGATYIYIMDDTGNVVFNAANRNIEQTDLWNFEGQHREGRDDDYRFFIRRIIDASKSPGGDFVEYDWDNPTVEGDEPAGLGEPGGTSSKLGYAIQLPADGEIGKVYVFGTGLYVRQEEEPLSESDSGCSLAGPYAEVRSAAVNILAVMGLIALVFLLTGRFSRSRSIPGTH